MSEQSILEASRKAQKKNIFKFSKKKIGIILVILVLGFSAYYYLDISKDVDSSVISKKTTKVAFEDLKISIESSGKVVAKDGVELSFSISGNTTEVKDVYVSEGQKINKGDKIASIETDSLEFDLRSAYSNYQSALTNFNTKQAGATQVEIDRYKNSLEQAKLSLEQAKLSLEQTKSNVEKNIRNSETSLVSAENNLKLNKDEQTSAVVNDAYDNLYNSMKSLSMTITKALEDSDNILGVDDSSLNEDFKILLSAKNYTYLSAAKDSYILAKNENNSLKNLMLSLNSFSSQDDLDQAAMQMEKTLEIVEKNAYDVKNVLDATITSSDFSQNELDSLRSKINSTRSSLAGASSSLTSSLQALENSKRSLVSLELAYNKAVDDLEAVKKEADQSIANAITTVENRELALQKAEIDYKDIIEPTSESDMSSVRAQLTSASISVDKAKYAISQATLVSPIDGQVALLNYKKGDIIIKDSAKSMASIINNETLFIEVKIEESDINKIKIGQKVQASFDAVDEAVLEGEVSFISLTSETSSNGIVTYLVRVLFVNNNDQIREGMTADVEFITAGVENVLTVPVAAVRNVKGEASVEISDGNYVPVVTGFTDGKKVEIISGLKQGDSIIY